MDITFSVSYAIFDEIFMAEGNPFSTSQTVTHFISLCIAVPVHQELLQSRCFSLSLFWGFQTNEAV
jgi:hypothetical protein